MKRSPAFLALAALLLAGCQPTTTPGTPPVISVNAVVNDIVLLDDAVTAALPALGTLARVSPEDMAQVYSYAAQVHAAAAQLAADTSGTVSAPIARQAVTAFQAMVPVLLRYLPLNTSQRVLIQAGAALLPDVLAAAGLAGAAPSTGGLTSAQGRTILLAHHRASGR